MLDEVVAAVRAHPGLSAKASIGLVRDVLGETDWEGGPGDDAAVLRTAHDLGGGQVVACGEALWPPFVAADPYGAGFAAVLTNVNDVAAMGAVPAGIVDTIVGTEQVARHVLAGMRHASELYDVPIVGGHLTVHDGPPAISAFAVGTSTAALSVTRMAAGQRLLLAAALQGSMRPDFPFFPAYDERGSRCAGDVRLLAELAASGVCVAAKDVSMAGVVGSAAMLLEWGGFGVTLDLHALPAPPDVPLAAWLTCFPSYAFLLCVPPGLEDDCVAAFRARHLDCAVVGELDRTGRLSLHHAGQVAPVLDLTETTITGLRGRS